MTLPFTNTTELRDNNSSDYDLISKHNNLKREKDGIRNTVTLATIIILTILVDIFLFFRGFTLNWRGYVLSVIICSFPGYFLSNLIIKFKYGDEMPKTSQPKTVTYTFSDSGIKSVSGMSIDYIMYSDITEVTQDPYYYYMNTRMKKHHVSKSGFSTSSEDFEELMKSKGISVRI